MVRGNIDRRSSFGSVNFNTRNHVFHPEDIDRPISLDRRITRDQLTLTQEHLLIRPWLKGADQGWSVCVFRRDRRNIPNVSLTWLQRALDAYCVDEAEPVEASQRLREEEREA